MSLSNPLNIALIPPILYLIYRIAFPTVPPANQKLPDTYSEDTYNWLPAKHPDVTLFRKFSAKDLSRFDGVDGGKILLAIMRIGRNGKVPEGGRGERTVFDVSAGRGFYGPEGVYGNFAGRDASRGMAKQSFDEDMLTDLDKPLDTLADLTPAEVDNMKGWHEHFERKYIVCGQLVDDSEAD